MIDKPLKTSIISFVFFYERDYKMFSSIVKIISNPEEIIKGIISPGIYRDLMM